MLWGEEVGGRQAAAHVARLAVGRRASAVVLPTLEGRGIATDTLLGQ